MGPATTSRITREVSPVDIKCQNNSDITRIIAVPMTKMLTLEKWLYKRLDLPYVESGERV